MKKEQIQGQASRDISLLRNISRRIQSVRQCHLIVFLARGSALIAIAATFLHEEPSIAGLSHSNEKTRGNEYRGLLIVGGNYRTRTCDPMRVKHVLSQLS